MPQDRLGRHRPTLLNITAEPDKALHLLNGKWMGARVVQFNSDGTTVYINLPSPERFTRMPSALILTNQLKYVAIASNKIMC